MKNKKTMSPMMTPRDIANMQMDKRIAMATAPMEKYPKKMSSKKKIKHEAKETLKKKLNEKKKYKKS